MRNLRHFLTDVTESDDTKSFPRKLDQRRIPIAEVLLLAPITTSDSLAMAMIVRGFVEPIAKELPMEYALELNRLIELQMEGSVG